MTFYKRIDDEHKVSGMHSWRAISDVHKTLIPRNLLKEKYPGYDHLKAYVLTIPKIYNS